MTITNIKECHLNKTGFCYFSEDLMKKQPLLGHKSRDWYTRDCQYRALQRGMLKHLEQEVVLGELPDKVPMYHFLQKWG